MAIDDKIKDEKLQYEKYEKLILIEKQQKISALSSDKID